MGGRKVLFRLRPPLLFESANRNVPAMVSQGADINAVTTDMLRQAEAATVVGQSVSCGETGFDGNAAVMQC